MKAIKTIFFGTHNFATTILQGLIDDNNIDVVLVVTQPDKPVGRKKILTPSPVKLLAEKHNINLEQPHSLKNWEPHIEKWDIGITAQYGLIVPNHILETPQYGMLNVHTSLLPKYRGASPIQSALINGEKETGITIIKMDEGLDTGPILLQKTIIIDKEDTYITLDSKLAPIASQALLEAIPKYINGSILPSIQDDSKASYCKQFSREDGKINWNKSASEIFNQYRGMNPWPGIWTTWENKRLKLLNIKISDEKINPGEVLVLEERLIAGCGVNSIEVIELQLEGKKAMNPKTFINGNKDFGGSILK